MKSKISASKVVLFSALALVLSFGLIEGFAQTLCLIRYHAFPWQLPTGISLFNVRPYTEMVSDERVFTLKRGASVQLDREIFHPPQPASLDLDDPRKTWTVETDENRFRRGKNAYAAKELNNIVFIGDSVPFGYAVDGDLSVPSLFYQRLQRAGMTGVGVVNAAVPSYSMNQAIQRYYHEIRGKLPVQAVVLHVIDPVSLFVMMGRKWNKSRVQVSADQVVAAPASGLASALKKAGRISAVAMILYKGYSARYLNPSGLDLQDQEAFREFDAQNSQVLEEFSRQLAVDGTPLVLLPINWAFAEKDVTKGDFHFQRLAVGNHFNTFLREFAKTHAHTYYFDVARHFQEKGTEKKFIDMCCHLSESGAKLEAEYLFDEVNKAHLLANTARELAGHR